MGRREDKGAVHGLKTGRDVGVESRCFSASKKKRGFVG